MLKKIICSSLLATALVAPVFADTDIVVDNFDSYADDAAFQAAWVPTIGNGTAAANFIDTTSGILTTDTSLFPELQGKGVDHIGASASSPGMVNQFGGIINQQNGQNPVFNIAPSATQSVVLKYDIYDSASGNERMTVGLRHINVSGSTITTTNLVELGFYNSNSADPTNPGDWSAPPVNNAAGNATVDTPGFYTGRGYGARINLYGPFSDPLNHTPDWQYFRTTGETWGGQAGGDLGFTSEIDRTTDTDEVVTVGDIGAGWHHFEATITPDSVTFTIDFFRDGLRNTSRTPDEFGVRPGTPGFDAKMVFPVAAHPQGFNSLRFGGPSGLLSQGAGAQAFDNISLSLVDVVIEPPTGNADFDNDGDIDGRDFLIWQRGFGTPDALRQDGNANPDVDGDVDGDDLIVWQAQYGQTPPLVSTVAVPEPAAGMLILTALGSLLSVRRR